MKFLPVFLCAALLAGCAHPKVLEDGKEYEPYGLVNTGEQRDPNVVYKIPAANFVVGFIFSESLFVPGYILCFDLYEPVRLRDTQNYSKVN